MRKYIIILSFMIYACMSHAQSNCKLGIGINISPDYTLASISTKDSLDASWKKFMNTKHSATFSYTSGFSMQGKLLGVLSIETGLSYTIRADQSLFDTSITNQLVPWKDQNYYNYLQMPVKLKLNFVSGRSTIFISGGASAMAMINAYKTTGPQGQEGKREQLHTSLNDFVNFTVLFSAGIDFRVTKRIFFRIEPNFSKTLREIHHDNLMKSFKTGGINAGLFFVVKRNKDDDKHNR